MRLDWLSVTTLGGAFLGGIVLAALSAMRIRLSQRLAVDDFWIGRLKTVFTLVLIPLMLVTGVALDRWGTTETIYEALILGALLAVLALGTLAVRTTYRAALAGAVLLSAAAACLVPSATLLMPQALLNLNFPVQAMNLGYVAVGLGFLLAGPLFALLQRKLGFDRGLLVVALLALLYGGFVALPDKEAARRLGQPYDATFDLYLVLACLVAVFYFPLEGSLSAWAAKYLSELGFKPSSIPWVLAGFWLCFLGSRLTVGLFLDRRYETLLLILMVATIAVTFWNLAGAGPSSGAKGMLVMWACFGPVFPTLLGLCLPRAHGGATAFALVFGAGAFSNLIFQPALRPADTESTAQATLRMPRLLALLLVVPALVLVLIVDWR